MRYLHLQHHDRNNDCDHAIAERLQPPLGHLSSLQFSRAEDAIISGSDRVELALLSGLCLGLHSILCITEVSVTQDPKWQAHFHASCCAWLVPLLPVDFL